VAHLEHSLEWTDQTLKYRIRETRPEEGWTEVSRLSGCLKSHSTVRF